MGDASLFAGIDLGTTNSACQLGRLDGEGGAAVEPLDIAQLVKDPRATAARAPLPILPSCVWLHPDGAAYAGEWVRALGPEIAQWPGSRVVRSIKRQMGSATWALRVGNAVYRPPSVAGLLLRTIRRSIDEARGAAPVGHVTITVPASFSSVRRHDTQVAAALAGFESSAVSLLDEPVAALLGNWDPVTDGIRGLPDERSTVLVFDMGGGTLDISVLEVHPARREIGVCATSRYNEVAGDDLDLELAALLLHSIRGAPGYDGFLEFAGAERAESQRRAGALLDVAERLKLELGEVLARGPRFGSYRDRMRSFERSGAAIPVALAPEFDGCSPDGVEVPVHTALEALERFFDAAVVHDPGEASGRSVFVPIGQALQRAGDVRIDRVFITGGASAFPPVQDALSGYFHRELQRLDPFQAVARGAAAWPILRRRGWRIRESIQDGLYLKRLGHPFLEVLRSVPVPCDEQIRSFEDEDCPSLTGSGRSVRLEFFQGSSPGDALMALAHVEHLALERELGEQARLREVSGAVDANKVFHFRLVFEDGDGTVDAAVAFRDGTLPRRAAAGDWPRTLNGEAP